jgi:hypothetical membrane protein
MSRRLLLLCGVASSALYTLVNVVAPLRYPDYDVRSRAVSELSAIGAPTRPLMIATGLPYGLLVLAFAWGVWRSGDGNRPLRAAAASLAAFAVLGFLAPFTPMHPRGSPFALTDVLHIACTVVTVLLMLLSIGYGAAALGPGFRAYSIVTLLVHLTFGARAATDGPRLARGLPTPWIGVTERINISVFMLWVVVLAVMLMQRPSPHGQPRPNPEAPATPRVTGALGNWLLG